MNRRVQLTTAFIVGMIGFFSSPFFFLVLDLLSQAVPQSPGIVATLRFPIGITEFASFCGIAWGISAYWTLLRKGLAAVLTVLLVCTAAGFGIGAYNSVDVQGVFVPNIRVWIVGIGSGFVTGLLGGLIQILLERERQIDRHVTLKELLILLAGICLILAWQSWRLKVLTMRF